VDEELLCMRRRRAVEVNRASYETFEKMHWVCFHYEFEHLLGDSMGDTGDPDRACADPHCPARAFDSQPPPTWFESRDV
jgi:hypothetical protein